MPPTNPEDEGRGHLVNSREIHTGRVVQVAVDRVKLPNGHTVDLDMVRHPGAAPIVPFISSSDILLVRQYRWAAGGFIYEIPAGKLDDGTEDPLLCARRELEEEVGHQAGKWHPLGPIVTAPGFTDEVIHLYMATDLILGNQALEADEILQVERVPFTTALDWALSGRIKDAKTLCGLLRADLHRRHPTADR